MAVFNVIRARSHTLTISQVDTVNFSSPGDRLVISARGPTTDFISFTIAGPGGTPATPTALGDDCFVVQGGQTLTIPIDGSVAIGSVSMISAQAAPMTVMAAQ